MNAATLKQKALELGAQSVGIAPARPLPEADIYGDWLETGKAGTMDYMARNKEVRSDISRWYPEAKSVLVCAFSYADNKTVSAPSGEGRLARYATASPDYHKELKRRMKDILAWLKLQEPRADGRWFVDTSPVLERLYGRYAGVGWVGKNTMLIGPRLGSYFFLAGLALNLDFQTDEPMPDHCGTCRRCLSACPTEAFPRERVLDASRCISYFTIEHRGAIAEEFRPKVGNWVIGCDICQEVCPWNRFSFAGPAFEKSDPQSAPLEELAELSEEEFQARFAGSPVTRAKRRGLVRNALLAMGNSGEARFKPVVEKYLNDEDPVLQDQARWSLKRL